MTKRSPIVLLAASAVALTAGMFSTGATNAADGKPKSASVKVTYAEHIAPMLNQHCVECHRPGEVAPFSLIGYENAKKYAPTMALATSGKRMPPWKAVHGFGEFLDENRLTPEEILLLRTWANAGTPRGDAKKEPPQPKFASEWALGQPDLVLQPEKAFKLGAEGADVYRNFVLKTDFKETRWVTAMDVRPGNAKVVHHVIAFLDGTGRSVDMEAKTKDGQPGYSTFGGPGFIPSGSLGGWAPGFRPRRTTEDVAFELKPGTNIVLQVHYHKSGKPEIDQTRIGLYFAKQPPAKDLKLAWIANPIFRLPPGADNHKVEVRWPIPRDVTVYGVMPHMHLLGRSMKATVVKPDGSTIPLVYIDDWDFNWQIGYQFKKPIKVPQGSRIYVEAYYDNSAKNPRNPNNPPNPVTWGEETTDEMFLLVAAYTVD
jgi:mono/diheme cytochrome c family protein